MSSQNQKNEDVLRYATRMVACADFLMSNDEFNEFNDHVKRFSDQLADEILHGEMTDDEREKKRQFRLGILWVLRSPTDMRKANMDIIERSGR